ncbi:acyl-CoA dehydrogenase [Rhodococcus wratislaviensis]|uniref:acyl-CoA dehydrogenase n=1 Tax=Rhodococcus wratislaviensis TaxID=44752 RepID=UPI00365E4BDB
MALALSEEHKELASVAEAHLARCQVRRAARQTLDATSYVLGDFWSATAELGWMGLHVPEEFGGSGYGLAELTIVVEALGHEIAPVPFVPTVAASAIVDRFGSDTIRSKYLFGLVDGTTVGAVGISRGVIVNSDGIVSGESHAVLGAPQAEHLLLVAGDDVVLVNRADSGVSVTEHRGLDTTRSIGRVTLANVALPEERILRGAANGALALFRILLAAESVGSAKACLEMANDYAKVREQFGRPIGMFQAVKHHLANMLIDSELAVAATWDAARSSDVEHVQFAAAVAALHGIRAQLLNARRNIQLHGGVGYTWEHDAHLYLKRAETVAAVLSDGPDVLTEVVDAARAGNARGASFVLPEEAANYREKARDAAARLRRLPESERRDYLVDSGYLVPHWHKPWGRDAGIVEQLVIEEEFEGIDLPDIGITGWIALTLSQEGSAEQKGRWIDPILRGQTRWCQLFSEPGAGSDAAAVRTSANRVDGGWRVTGQKVWTSTAMECQWGLSTVRTDSRASKHAGVTMMAIDLTAPGVEIRPLRELTGEAMFNEVFFDDVFVPDSDVIGGEGHGWKVARATLGNERVSIAGGSGSIGFTGVDLIKLLDDSSTVKGGDERAVGELLAEEHVLRLMNLRQAARAILGAGMGAEANVTKIMKAEHSQRMTEMGMKLASRSAVIGEAPALVYDYLYARCLTIAGGTSEIMRNTIGERLLGLPRDPLVR